MAGRGLSKTEQGLRSAREKPQRGVMRPTDIQVIGREVALKWDDGAEQFLPWETLRRFCPCAACMGEKDIFGTTYRPPERPYGTGAFELAGLHPVGGYAVQPAWRDGHNTGIYSWEWLRRVADAALEAATTDANGAPDGADRRGCGGGGGCGGHGHDHGGVDGHGPAGGCGRG